MPQASFKLNVDKIKFGRNCKIELDAADADSVSRHGSVATTHMPSEDSFGHAVRAGSQRQTSSQCGSPVPSNSVTDLVELENELVSEDAGASSTILAVRNDVEGTSSSSITPPSSPRAHQPLGDTAVPPSPLPVAAPVLPPGQLPGLRTRWMSALPTMRTRDHSTRAVGPSLPAPAPPTPRTKSRKWWARQASGADTGGPPPAHSVADVIHEEQTLRGSERGQSRSGSIATSEWAQLSSKQMLTQYTLSVRFCCHLAHRPHVHFLAHKRLCFRMMYAVFRSMVVVGCNGGYERSRR